MTTIATVQCSVVARTPYLHQLGEDDLDEDDLGEDDLGEDDLGDDDLGEDDLGEDDLGEDEDENMMLTITLRRCSHPVCTCTSLVRVP